MKKKGLSQIVATVLLISVSLILAILIFTWAKSFIFALSPPVDCNEIKFRAEISDNNLNIVNIGPKEINGFVIKSRQTGEIQILEEISHTVAPGKTETITLTESYSQEEILIIPIITTETIDSETQSTCPDQFGFEI